MRWRELMNARSRGRRQHQPTRRGVRWRPTGRRRRERSAMTARQRTGRGLIRRSQHRERNRTGYRAPRAERCRGTQPRRHVGRTRNQPSPGPYEGGSRMRRRLESAMIWPWRPSLVGRSAVNLPEHADNPVHTVEGGLAAGYDGAVVAGTTVFAYLTRPVAARGDERGSWVVATRSGSVGPCWPTSESWWPAGRRGRGVGR